MADMELLDVLDFIRHADKGELDRVVEEWKLRSRALQRIRPKYLCGARGFVERLDGDKVTVRFDGDERQAIQRCGPLAKVGASAIDLVDGAEADDDLDLQEAAAEAAALALENRGR